MNHTQKMFQIQAKFNLLRQGNFIKQNMSKCEECKVIIKNLKECYFFFTFYFFFAMLGSLLNEDTVLFLKGQKHLKQMLLVNIIPFERGSSKIKLVASSITQSCPI